MDTQGPPDRARGAATVPNPPQSGDSDSLAPGAMLGTYRIERLLGRGGMGIVYQAHDTVLHRPVALKVLAAAHGVEARTPLLREARSVAALNHPSICTVYEVGEVDGRAFIAMEYIDGQPLDERLRASALPLHEAVAYGIAVANALGYAHEHGVVHRDLKAANAMVTADGRLKLVDFGLARRNDALLAAATVQASLLAPGTIAGTPYSMAPEQVRGGFTDSRTDVWALGVLLYEMVGGAKPFDAGTSAELYSSILRDRPAPLPSAVPSGLSAVIERCLEKAPEHRYTSARGVREALEALDLDAGPSWGARLARVERRYFAAAVIVVAVAGLLFGANVGGVRDRGPSSTGSIRLAVLPFENLTGDPVQEYFSDGLTAELITQLGRLHPERLSVIARTSSMRFKGSDQPVDVIGRELGVDYVLEGSARREGERVRINATLVQVSDQAQRWSDTFERELAGILAMQNDAARWVARSLQLTLLPTEQGRLARAQPVHPEAFEAYLRGRFHSENLTPADLDLALRYFQTALQHDPRHAAAYAGIAMVWTGRSQMGYVAPSIAIPEVRGAASRAVELDGDLALAHYALGLAAWAEFDVVANEREFLRAIELDPSFPEPRAAYSHLLMALKRPDEALAQIERARQVDPLNTLFQALHGVDLYLVRRYDDAIAQLEGARAAVPELPVAHCGLWYAYHATRRGEPALEAAAGCIGHYGAEVRAALELDGAAADYRATMRRVADLLAAGSGSGYVAPVDVLISYVHAGERDFALDWLARAVDARDPNVYGAVVDPLVADSLSALPRFRELVQGANLPL